MHLQTCTEEGRDGDGDSDGEVDNKESKIENYLTVRVPSCHSPGLVYELQLLNGLWGEKWKTELLSAIVQSTPGLQRQGLRLSSAAFLNPLNTGRVGIFSSAKPH